MSDGKWVLGVVKKKTTESWNILFNIWNFGQHWDTSLSHVSGKNGSNHFWKNWIWISSFRVENVYNQLETGFFFKWRNGVFSTLIGRWTLWMWRVRELDTNHLPLPHPSEEKIWIMKFSIQNKQPTFYHKLRWPIRK